MGNPINPTTSVNEITLNSKMKIIVSVVPWSTEEVVYSLHDQTVVDYSVDDRFRPSDRNLNYEVEAVNYSEHYCNIN